MGIEKGTILTDNDTRFDGHIPKELKTWLKGYAKRLHVTQNSIMRRLLEQERAQVDGAFGTPVAKGVSEAVLVAEREAIAK